MKTYVIVLSLLIVGIFYASMCTNIFPPDPPPGDSTLILNKPLHVTFKDTLVNYKKHLWLTFDSLITDSRCPTGAECVWEGNAELSFIFNSIPFNLNTHPSFTTDTTILNYHIEMLNVTPYPHIDSVYTDEQYTAEIIVTR